MVGLIFRVSLLSSITVQCFHSILELSTLVSAVSLWHHFVEEMEILLRTLCLYSAPEKRCFVCVFLSVREILITVRLLFVCFLFHKPKLLQH